MGIETATLLAYAAAAGTVVSAGAAIYSADQQSDAENARAAQADADAAAAAGAARVQARKIRDAAKAERASAVAALAASGVEVQTGTAEQIQVDIDRRGEEDALSAILEGSTRGRFLNREAADARRRGDAAMTAGYLDATSSVLSSVASSQRKSGWRGTTGTWDLSRTTRGSGD